MGDDTTGSTTDATVTDVAAPTLLIVGGDDEPVIGMNESALGRLSATT